MAGERIDVADRWETYFRDQCQPAIDALAAEFPDRRSLYIDLLDLHRHDAEFTRALFAQPDRVLTRAAEVLGASHEGFDRVNVRVENNPGLLGVDGIRVRHHHELVTVEGVVTETDPVHARARLAVLECRSCGASVRRRPTGIGIDPPGVCPECGSDRGFSIDRGATRFVDAQRVLLREGDEGAGRGLPIYLDDDIVDTVSLEQEVRATGIIRLRERTDPGRYTFYLDTSGVSEERPATTDPEDDDGAALKDLIEARWKFVVDS